MRTGTVRPVDAAAGPATRRDRSGVRARVVTYGAVVALAACAALSLEPWPLGSFRLFSEPRTGERSALVLVAVDGAGAAVPVRFTGDRRAVRSAQRQLPDLVELEPAERRRRVRAWLRLAGVDPGPIREVVLQRVRRRLDLDGGPSRELARVDVLRIPLR